MRTNGNHLLRVFWSPIGDRTIVPERGRIPPRCPEFSPACFTWGSISICNSTSESSHCGVQCCWILCPVGHHRAVQLFFNNPSMRLVVVGRPASDGERSLLYALLFLVLHRATHKQPIITNLFYWSEPQSRRVDCKLCCLEVVSRIKKIKEPISVRLNLVGQFSHVTSIFFGRVSVPN